MTARRTIGMTVIAALSLLVGVLGLLGSGGMVSDGLGLTRLGSATSPAPGEPPAGINAPVVAFGAIRAALSLCLVGGAVGTLTVAPWGRRLSLAFAVGWILAGAVEPFALRYRFGWAVFASALYPFLLLGVFSRPGWRAAFAAAAAAAPGEPSGSSAGPDAP